MVFSKRVTSLLPGLVLAGILLLPPTLGFGQVKVTHITASDGTAGRKGVLYALPRTVLEIELTLIRTDRIPGPYAQFAPELLGINDAISTQQTSYSLEKACIIPRSEADPDQVYLVEKDDKSSDEVFFAFSGNGLIMGTYPVAEEQGIQGEDREEFFGRTFSATEMFPNYHPGAMKENIDTITRIVTFDTLTYTEKILKRTMVKQSDREKAEEAVSMINSIGQDKYTLLIGYQETAYSEEALKFMTAQLEEQRLAYLQLFTGTTRREQITLRLSYLPPAETTETVAITGFSPLVGLTSPDGTSDVTVELVKKGLTEVMGTDPSATGSVSGFFYRIPENCEAVVKYKGEVLGSRLLPVCQAGIVRSLPPSVTQLEFYPETGAIKKIVLK